jgi:hypothetical protein
MFKLLIFVVSLSLWAQDQTYLYSGTILGEKDFSQYYGPFDPTIKRGGIGEPNQFLDDFYKDNYLIELVGSDFFKLLDFVANDLPRESMCSNFHLNKNAKNIKYLFSLLSISYLFENLKAIKIASYNLGFGDICSLEWEDTFQKCRAKEIPMANFIKRIKGNHLKDFSNKALGKMKNEERDLWIKSFHKEANSFKNLDLAQSRILYFCKTNDLDCRNIGLEDLKFAFQLSCSEDQNLLLNICSNTDELYGLSNVKGAPKLIAESDAFKKLDKEGFGSNCIRRFINVYKPKEVKNPLFEVIFPKIEDLMIKNKKTYVQGSLFVYGSLEEFETKGLEGFLFSGSEEIKKPEITPPNELEKKEKVTAIEIPTIKGLLEIAHELKKVSGIDSTKISTVKTAFLQAEMKRFMADSLKEPIDMGVFKKETAFAENIDDPLQERIYLYERKTTFEKLKEKENLGKAIAPFPLSFLKYLIDFNEQQALNNLLEVLSNKFFVVNDLEPSSKVYYIQMSSEGQRIQFYILKQEREINPKFK